MLFWYDAIYKEREGNYWGEFLIRYQEVLNVNNPVIWHFLSRPAVEDSGVSKKIPFKSYHSVLKENLSRFWDSSRDKLTLRDQRYLPKIPRNLLFLRSVTSQPWYWYANINQHVILFTINDYFFINITTKSCSQHLEQRNRDQGKVIYSRRYWGKERPVISKISVYFIC